MNDLHDRARSLARRVVDDYRKRWSNWLYRDNRKLKDILAAEVEAEIRSVLYYRYMEMDDLLLVGVCAANRDGDERLVFVLRGMREALEIKMKDEGIVR